MINVKVKAKFRSEISKAVISQTAAAVIAHMQPEQDQDITIVIEDDAFIQKLNRTYLGIDSPTDVLSFSTDEIDPESNNNYLGDIIISLPRAAEQAQKAGHAIQSEVQLLIVHGILHLSGYDHADLSSKQEMWRVQQELIDLLGIAINQLPED